MTRAEAQRRAMCSQETARKNLGNRETQALCIVPDMWREGMTQRHIAAAIGCSRSKVERQIAKAGIVCSPDEWKARNAAAPRAKVQWTDEMTRELVRLRASGDDLRTCADRVGVSYRTAWAKARALGINGRVAT